MTSSQGSCARVPCALVSLQVRADGYVWGIAVRRRLCFLLRVAPSTLPAPCAAVEAATRAAAAPRAVTGSSIDTSSSSDTCSGSRGSSGGSGVAVVTAAVPRRR
jgi:hypothetical protein